MFEIWSSGNADKIDGIGILVQEDLSINVVKINMTSNRVMVIAIIFGKKEKRIVCAYAPLVEDR